jgi:CRISPR system Cascade subunit CasB
MQADVLDLDEAVTRLAKAVARLPPGPLAELRRPAGGEGSPTFWRLWHSLELPYRERPWDSVLQAIAILTPTGQDDAKPSAHDGRHPLGRALHEAGVSDLRVSRLLAAPPAERRRALLRLARMLARTELRFDLRALARLMLFDTVEPEKRRLARDYYAAEAAATKAKDTSSDA